MIKIALIGIVTVVAAAACKGIKSEYSLYIGLVGCILLAYIGIGKLESMLEVISRFEGYMADNAGYITIMLKMLGIAYIAGLASDISKDAGYNAVASQIEMAGKFSILLISTPILEALLDTVFTML